MALCPSIVHDIALRILNVLHNSRSAESSKTLYQIDSRSKLCWYEPFLPIIQLIDDGVLASVTLNLE